MKKKKKRKNDESTNDVSLRAVCPFYGGGGAE
jgi:hypothetical protein